MCSVELITRESDGQVVVVLRGELDVEHAARVTAGVPAPPEREREREIIVDLAGLDFIDSSGVAALARARKNARRVGGDVLLAAPGQQVIRVLTLTRLIDVFPVHACVDDAAVSGRRTRPAVARGAPARYLLAAPRI